MDLYERLLSMHRELSEKFPDPRPYGNKTWLVCNEAAFCDLQSATRELSAPFAPLMPTPPGILGGMRVWCTAYVYPNGVKTALGRDDILLVHEDKMAEVIGPKFYEALRQALDEMVRKGDEKPPEERGSDGRLEVQDCRDIGLSINQRRQRWRFLVYGNLP